VVEQIIKEKLTGSLRGAIKKGQESMQEHIDTLTEQNTTIIDNMNEMIMLLKKVCVKLDVDAVVETCDTDDEDG
jgi:hypothetical protein